MKNRRAITDLIFLSIIIFLAFASFISYKRIIKLNEASNLVVHTNTVKLKLAQTISLIKEAENKLQDSINTETSVFNALLQKDSAMAFRKLDELDSLTHDNSAKRTGSRS